MVRRRKTWRADVAAARLGKWVKKWRTLGSMPSRPGEVQLVFEDLPAGDYAVSVMHDANKNGELDKTAIGIPKEGFGFSNNVLGRFGPPKFKEAKFTMPLEKTLVITLKYH